MSPPGKHDKTVRRWQERAVEWLRGDLGRFLDYGCGPCGLFEKLEGRFLEYHGVDVDADKIEAARSKFPHAQLGAIGLDGRTAYPDEFFDTVAAVEVIEHVPDEAAMLAELARVLKPGGRLLLTTPHRGLLTFLDPGNFKFVFPRLHRFIHLRLGHNREYYRERFIRGREKGLAGDISIGERPPWHRHYKPQEIVAFCPPTLRPERYAVYFPAMRALMTLRIVIRVLTLGWIRRLLWPLSALERRLSGVESRTGDQLVMNFRKVP